MSDGQHYADERAVGACFTVLSLCLALGGVGMAAGGWVPVGLGVALPGAAMFLLFGWTEISERFR